MAKTRRNPGGTRRENPSPLPFDGWNPGGTRRENPSPLPFDGSTAALVHEAVRRAEARAKDAPGAPTACDVNARVRHRERGWTGMLERWDTYFCSVRWDHNTSDVYGVPRGELEVWVDAGTLANIAEAMRRATAGPTPPVAAADEPVRSGHDPDTIDAIAATMSLEQIRRAIDAAMGRTLARDRGEREPYALATLREEMDAARTAAPPTPGPDARVQHLAHGWTGTSASIERDDHLVRWDHAPGVVARELQRFVAPAVPASGELPAGTRVMDRHRGITGTVAALRRDQLYVVDWDPVTGIGTGLEDPRNLAPHDVGHAAHTRFDPGTRVQSRTTWETGTLVFYGSEGGARVVWDDDPYTQQFAHPGTLCRVPAYELDGAVGEREYARYNDDD
jgi:hypothetical protein